MDRAYFNLTFASLKSRNTLNQKPMQRSCKQFTNGMVDKPITQWQSIWHVNVQKEDTSIRELTRWLDGSSSSKMWGFLNVIFANATLLFWPPKISNKTSQEHGVGFNEKAIALVIHVGETIPDSVYIGCSARFPVMPNEPKWPLSFCSATPCRSFPHV